LRLLLGLCFLACLFVSGAVKAATGLCWSRATNGTENWQVCAGKQVASRATVGGYGQYDGGTFRLFESIPANEAVYICEADRPVGSGAGCPTSGTYTQERYVLKSSLVTEPPPPPPAYAPAVVFSIEPRAPVEGSQITLSWSTTDIESCEATWRTGVGLSGTETIAISGDRYRIACKGLDGLQYASGIQINILPPSPPAPPWTPYVARCYPTGENGIAMKTSLSLAGFEIRGWECDDALGYEWPWRSFNVANFLARVSCAGNLASFATTEAVRDIDIRCQRELTEAEATAGLTLQRKWAAHFPVSGSTTRPVYTRTATGTRGAQLRVNGVNQTIAAGNLCNGSRRLTGTTTRYNDCAGRTSVQGELLPEHSYAQTTKANAPATGWP
jgi:hypothetical protein